MAKDGSIIEGAQDPNLDEEMLIKMYKTMVKVHVMDNVMNKVQRQGGISFYMMMAGEEALVGSAAALELSDPMWAQYVLTGGWVSLLLSGNQPTSLVRAPTHTHTSRP